MSDVAALAIFLALNAVALVAFVLRERRWLKRQRAEWERYANRYRP